jgi:cytohesin
MGDLLTITDHLFQAALRYIERGNVNGMESLLRERSEIAHIRGTDDRSVIHLAAELGNVDIISLLLDAGADPNLAEGKRLEEDQPTRYQPGYVSLHYAARAGHEEAVALLLARGAAANAEDYCGGTPLHVAHTPRIAEALLLCGADPNAICWMRHCDEVLGWHFVGSPLHVAAQQPIIRMLIGNGANVDGSDHITKRTALHYAAARGRAEAVEALLELGADPNASAEVPDYTETRLITPLHYAALGAHEEIVRLLLAAGAVRKV